MSETEKLEPHSAKGDDVLKRMLKTPPKPKGNEKEQKSDSQKEEIADA